MRYISRPPLRRGMIKQGKRAQKEFIKRHPYKHLPIQTDLFEDLVPIEYDFMPYSNAYQLEFNFGI